MTFSQFPEFFSGSNAIKIHLKIEDEPLEASPLVKLQEKGKQDIFPQSSLIELHPVFSHISLLLIETLSVTQHGEFTTCSKKGKYETVVELGGHMSQRYYLNQKELQAIQQIYQQIRETQAIRWLQSLNKI